MGTEAYSLDRHFFTEADFDIMGWHDNFVHAVAFGTDRRELSLDIDYILKWEQPLPEEQHYRFWISPATLVFENVYRLSAQHADWIGLTILGIRRVEELTKDGLPYPTPLWRWELDCAEGGWDIVASGYRQFIRHAPVLSRSQHLSISERGGYDFTCPLRETTLPS